MTITQQVQASEFFANLTKGIICLDNSTFSSLDCWSKFFYKGVLKHKPIGSRSPLIFGSAVHTALEHYYKKQIELTDTAIGELVDFSLSKHSSELDMCCDPKRNTLTLQSLLFSYFHHARAFGEYLKPITINGELAVEQSFSLPLCKISITDWFDFSGEVTVMWEGKIDLIAHDVRTNEIGVWDHKTTSMLGDSFMDQYLRSNQFNGYLWGANTLAESPDFPDINTVGINAICNKAKGAEFKHFTFKRTPWHYRVEFPRFVYEALSSFFQRSSHSNRFACVGKYGKCEFFDLCEIHPTNRMDALLNSGAYELSTWSPLND